MSEVVPLPSFGEVFFDERGQERVLRVTWHEGTLVLSLWRGEMCTASFRMPMNDVGRLVDTLDEGFVEAGGQYPEEVGERTQVTGSGGYPGPEGFPGTGQYARPRPEDYAVQQPQPQPQPQPEPATQVIGPPEEPRQAAALSPTDVLVARGSTPPVDRSQDRTAGGYGPADVPSRENPLVRDALSYGQPQAEPFGPGSGEHAYQQPPGDPYARQQPDSYGTQPQGRRVDPYATLPQGRPADPYGASPQAAQADPYGATAPHSADLFAAPGGRRQQADPFAPPAERFPPPAHQPQPAPYPAPGHPTDSGGGQTQRAAYRVPSSDVYGYSPPAQADSYGFGTQQPVPQQPPQAGHPLDPRDLYGSPPAYQRGVDPADPLGLGAQQSEQRGAHSYGQGRPPSTGERLRPEQRYDERHRDEREERRDW